MAIADLVVLVADKDMEVTVRGLLARSQALAIRTIAVDVYRHPQRDPGCRLRSADFLRSFSRQYRYALVMFDHEGCGGGEATRQELESAVEERRSATGWQDRAAAIAFDPELENWVWSDSPEVIRVLGWDSVTPSLTMWLENEGFWQRGDVKPRRPKEAMERTLRYARKPRSASLFFELASRVSVQRCADPAFTKFKLTMQKWFPGD